MAVSAANVIKISFARYRKIDTTYTFNPITPLKEVVFENTGTMFKIAGIIANSALK